MIKEHRRTFKVLRIAFDLSMVVGAYYLLLWTTLKVANPLNLQVFLTPDYLRLPLLIAMCWLFAFVASGVYDGTRQAGPGKALFNAVRALALMLVVFSLGVFAFKIQFISRKFFLVYSGVCLALLFSGKSTEYLLLKMLRRLGFNTLSVLLVGQGPALAALASVFQQHQEWGYRVAGILRTGGGRKEARLPFRVLGGVGKLGQVLRGHIVDEIILAVPLEKTGALRGLLKIAAEAGVLVRMALDTGLPPWHMQVDNLGAQPLLVFTSHRRNPYLVILKKVSDYLGAFLILLLLSPLLLAVSLGILLTMGFPVIFKQKRLGHNGRAFFLYKFRTMVRDASRRQESLKHANEMNGPVFKIRNDPRVTPLGRFLRKWSLDELPQLLNVLRGELSLVGPRPLYFFEARKVPVWARRRYSVKPGLTCLWQVMGRNSLTFERWMQLDLEYIDTWSFWLDLKILLKTIPAVLASKGAY